MLQSKVNLETRFQKQNFGENWICSNKYSSNCKTMYVVLGDRFYFTCRCLYQKNVNKDRSMLIMEAKVQTRLKKKKKNEI